LYICLSKRTPSASPPKPGGEGNSSTLIVCLDGIVQVFVVWHEIPRLHSVPLRSEGQFSV